MLEREDCKRYEAQILCDPELGDHASNWAVFATQFQVGSHGVANHCRLGAAAKVPRGRSRGTDSCQSHCRMTRLAETMNGNRLTLHSNMSHTFEAIFV
jgi:hypothetical protein